MRLLLGVSLLIAGGFATGMNAWAQFDDLEVTLTQVARGYCHVIRFPQTWTIQHFEDRTGQRLFFGSPGSDYEFRVEGILATQFLVAGFTEFVGRNYYTNNRYIIDLSDPAAQIRLASREVWEASAIVPFTRKNRFLPRGTPAEDKPFEFHALKFARSGDIWDQSVDGPARLSPDQAWLVLQSQARRDQEGYTKVFFDFFNADTGRNVFLIEGSHSSINGGDADGALAKTGWLTERYFIVPLGRNMERCLVCDFGGHQSERGTKR
jgi:hypothetical protein